MMRQQTNIQPIASCKERRKYVRFNEGMMRVWIRRRGLLREFIKGEPAQWLNFNQFGLAFASKRQFEINDELIIDIKTATVTVTDLVAVIHNARRQAGKFRYGVQFYFGANSHMQSNEVKELLDSIEELLD